MLFVVKTSIATARAPWRDHYDMTIWEVMVVDVPVPQEEEHLYVYMEEQMAEVPFRQVLEEIHEAEEGVFDTHSAS